MTPQDPFERLTILERAQFLHDAAQRRHVEALDRQQAQLESQAQSLARHEAMLERQTQTMAQLADISGRLQATQERLTATLEAIKDLLNRPNGH